MSGFKKFVMQGNLVELAVAMAKERFTAPAEESTSADIALLTEIRDLLARRSDAV